MKELIKKTKIVWLLILAISFFGCEDDDDANLPEIVASFVQAINEDTGVVTFINLSENADSYTWDFGDGTTSTEINPTKVYPTGNYTVVLTAKNTAGASNTFEDQIVINIPLPINFPVNFDDPNVNYDVTTFNGASFQIVANPDPSGSNTSASNVGAITNSGAAFEGIFFNLGMPLDLSGLKSIKVNFWSNTPIDVLLKLEEGTGGPVETTASHGGTGWEEIYFTFDTSNAFSRFTIFIDGPGTTSGTFYLDDISQIDTADIPCQETELKFPIDFDCEGIDYAAKIVGNVSFTVVDNPQQSGINDEETKVGQITNSGEQWENAFFNLDVPIDFATDKGVKMKLFSDQALPILLKFEDGTEAPVENGVTHGGTGWEELTFVFDSSASYNDMVLFVDGPGTAAGTFYIDDLEQVFIEPTEPFDSGLLVNGDFEDGATGWIQGVDDNNPAPVKTEGGNSFYSIDIAAPDPNGNAFTINLSQKFEIMDGSSYKLVFDAWSDGNRSIIAGLGRSGTPDFANVNEVVNITATRTTYELTFDAVPGAADGRVLFDLAAEAGQVNIDNVAVFLESGSGGGSNATVLLDFENNLAGVTAAEFETSGALVDNPSSGGINTSAKVYEAAYTSGNQWWGGVGFVFDAGLDQATTVYKGKFYSTVAPTNVLFQVEVDGTGPTVGQVQEITTANEWVELTFTLENIPAGVNRILVRPDVGNQDGTKPNTGSLYIDDIAKVDGGSGGGGGSGGCSGGPTTDVASFPVDFENCQGFNVSFGSNQSREIVDNPVSGGINTSDKVYQFIKLAGADGFGGFQNIFDTGSFTNNSTITFKIYSTQPNQEVRLEIVAIPNDGSIGNPAPYTQTLTTANEWVEMSFDLSANGFPNASDESVYTMLVVKPGNVDPGTTPADVTFYIDDFNITPN
ncbi:MAG: PKD domain-containing protein [Flavobacteriaceae bacterium]|nr:PKD domain-containing protein [Flavobacteriaceae bacterium]